MMYETSLNASIKREISIPLVNNALSLLINDVEGFLDLGFVELLLLDLLKR